VGIVRQHDPSEITWRAMQWPVALHANDSIRDDKVSGNSSVDVEDTPIDAPPVKRILRPSVRDARHDSEQILHAQCDAGPVVCFHPTVPENSYELRNDASDYRDCRSRREVKPFQDPVPRFATPTCSCSTPWVALRRWIGAFRFDLEPWQTETEVLRA
jgi:hypothetical protein